MSNIRPEKEAIVAELKDRLDVSKYLIIVGFKGLTVEATSELRKKLAELDARLTVANNSFMARACQEAGWAGVESFIAGPSAMVTGVEGIVDVSKILSDVAKPGGAIVLKGGRMEGQVITVEDVIAMSKMPSREVLIGMLVGTIAAPLSGLAGVMRQKVSSILYALKAVEEKKGAEK